MFNVNLIPIEMQKKKQKGLLEILHIPLEVLIGVGGAAFVLLVVLHSGLILLNMLQIGQHQQLKSKWESLSSQKTEIDQVMSEMKALEERNQQLSNLIKEGSLQWAKKMNILSDVLPRGIWLNRVAYLDHTLYIEGSAFSREHKEMINVHNLTLAVKNSEEFLNYFSEIELGSMRRRKAGKVEIADFILTTHLIEEADANGR